MISVPFLTLAPTIKRRDEALVIETSLPQFLLSLTMLWRRIEVDPKRKHLTVSRRIFWLFGGKEVIPFQWIDSIEYRYDDLNPVTDLGGTGDSLDRYTVKLRLNTTSRQVHLCSFSGPGEFVNQSMWPDWMYWDEYAFDAVGDQTPRSLALVTLLQRMTAHRDGGAGVWWTIRTGRRPE